MPKYVSARLGEVIMVQFDGGEDLYEGIAQVVKERGIKSGLVLNIVGGLVRARLSYFHETGPLESTVPRIEEIPGPLEAGGLGIIGIKEDGEPYLHIHLVVTAGNQTICGHLHEGTIVRSLLPRSHFTIMIASIEGAILKLIWDKEAPKQYPDRFPLGAPCHELIPTAEQE
jgi:predicted DNA-binding protein with PD1-like motif